MQPNCHFQKWAAKLIWLSIVQWDILHFTIILIRKTIVQWFTFHWEKVSKTRKDYHLLKLLSPQTEKLDFCLYSKINQKICSAEIQKKRFIHTWIESELYPIFSYIPKNKKNKWIIMSIELNLNRKMKRGKYPLPRSNILIFLQVTVAHFLIIIWYLF